MIDTASDPFTRSTAAYQAAARRCVNPMPLAPGEVAMLKRARGWRGTMERRSVRGRSWMLFLVVGLIVATVMFLVSR